MTYTPTTWANAPSTSSPLSAANLNNIEQGIVDLETALADAVADIAALSALISPIYNSTLGADAASFDVTGIAGTYAHLRLVLSGRGTTAATSIDVRMRLNNDSGSNYGSQYVRGIATTASAAEAASATSAHVGNIAAASATASHSGAMEILIPNYAATTLFKNWKADGGWSQAITTSTIAAQALAGVWISTSAINRITLFPSAGNFLAGTRLTIYGLGA